MTTHKKQVLGYSLYTDPLIMSRYATHEMLVKCMRWVYSFLKNVVYRGLFGQHVTPQNKCKFVVHSAKMLSIVDYSLVGTLLTEHWGEATPVEATSAGVASPQYTGAR